MSSPPGSRLLNCILLSIGPRSLSLAYEPPPSRNSSTPKPSPKCPPPARTSPSLKSHYPKPLGRVLGLTFFPLLGATTLRLESLSENLREDPRPCRPPTLSPVAPPQTLQPFSAPVVSNPPRKTEPRLSQTVDKLSIARPVHEAQTDPFRTERICEPQKEEPLSLRKGLRRSSLVSIQDPFLSKRKRDPKSQLSFTSRTSKVLSKSDSKTIEGILASISNRSTALRPHTDSSSQIGRSFLKPRASRKEASENAHPSQNS